MRIVQISEDNCLGADKVHFEKHTHVTHGPHLDIYA